MKIRLRASGEFALKVQYPAQVVRIVPTRRADDPAECGTVEDFVKRSTGHDRRIGVRAFEIRAVKVRRPAAEARAAEQDARAALRPECVDQVSQAGRGIASKRGMEIPILASIFSTLLHRDAIKHDRGHSAQRRNAVGRCI